MKNKLLTLEEFLIEEGKKVGKSAVQYALTDYNPKDYKRAYYRSNYEKNKESWKRCRENKLTPCIYLLAKEGIIVYVGSTYEINNRIACHKCIGREFDKVYYKDLADVVENRKLLMNIEYYFMNQFQDTLVDCTLHDFIEDKEVIELIARIHYTVDWQEYPLRKGLME
jgi:hypothetical protein